MDKLVQVDRRDDRLFVIPYFRSVDGLYVQKQCITELLQPRALDVGEAVVSALAEFESGLPTPDWKTYDSPVYKAGNVSTWSQYVVGLSACHVEERDESVDVFPLRKERHSLVGSVNDGYSLARNASSLLLGEAVLAVLEQ